MDDLFSHINESQNNSDKDDVKPPVKSVEKEPKEKELNSMYWHDRICILCMVNRNELSCPCNYSESCVDYELIMKSYSEDKWYQAKRLVRDDEKYNQFKKLFKL